MIILFSYIELVQGWFVHNFKKQSSPELLMINLKQLSGN